jgi:prolyl-tRNA synthetase
MIMTHADDDGLRLPPRVAPKQVVVIPVVPKPEMEGAVFEYAEGLAAALKTKHYNGAPIEVIVDKRDMRGGDKSWEWIKKGIPVRLEVGPRDIDSKQAVLYRRDKGPREKSFLAFNEIIETMPAVLEDIQNTLFAQAKAFRDSNIRTDIKEVEEFIKFFTPQNTEKPEIHGGFVLAKWSGAPEALELLAQHKVTVRCLPLEQSGTEGRCVVTGKPATKDAIFAKAY